MLHLHEGCAYLKLKFYSKFTGEVCLGKMKPSLFGILLVAKENFVTFSSVDSISLCTGVPPLFGWRGDLPCDRNNFSQFVFCAPESTLMNAGTFLRIRIRRVFRGRLSKFIRCLPRRVAGDAVSERWFGRTGRWNHCCGYGYRNSLGVWADGGFRRLGNCRNAAVLFGVLRMQNSGTVDGGVTGACPRRGGSGGIAAHVNSVGVLRVQGFTF
jgi:hypothetical protein